MKTEEILQLFCKKSTAPYFREPFSVGAHTYSCDGIAILRVLGSHGPALEEHPPVEAVFPDGLFNGLGIGTDIDRHKLKKFLADNRCKRCNPQMEGVSEKCPECDGNGWLKLKSEYHEYSVDCEMCYENGYVEYGTHQQKSCPYCNGGALSPWAPSFDVEGMRINAEYLSRIQNLPGVRIYSTARLPDTEAPPPLYFRFDGGCGCIMTTFDSPCPERIVAIQ